MITSWIFFSCEGQYLNEFLYMFLACVADILNIWILFKSYATESCLNLRKHGGIFFFNQMIDMVQLKSQVLTYPPWAELLMTP